MSTSSRPRIRELGYGPGRFTPGPRNSLLDVQGVRVGQVTLHEGRDIHTGVTVILPRGLKNTRRLPCYAATHNLNGVGELTGSHCLAEWGFTNTPIALTNTVSVGKVYDALFLWLLDQASRDGEDDLQALRQFSIPVVGETFDGLLNDIKASVIDKSVVDEALKLSETQPEILEGNYGGGTAMRCHGYKGGTGTSSRIIPGADRNYTLGVLVQSNYGQKKDLRIGNVPIGELLDREKSSDTHELPLSGKAAEGSIIVVIMFVKPTLPSNSYLTYNPSTDAPLLPHQLRRIAQHAGMGVTQVGGHAAGRSYSGEIFLALSTGTSPNELATESSGFDYLPPVESQTVETVKNETIDSLFYAASEATEEAILNSMCKAEPLVGFLGRVQPVLPVEKVKELLDRYMVRV
ncbi:Peptidase family S58 [Aspergillus sclerotialis]|uniref:Peptidase family S58 n=1 Tax=Aspergillus sclerotialis TaxID=2070753 RepID=A0A3A2Z5Q1_9EURO|nr:Peptidase family S58 [Aspergillus sclerotialis]